ncbi:MAG: hypothetical protein MZV49_08110 [Rhodopseudomonas palustris]|nr:hypothetical protein [Rhodopseudomonas palustris]
MMSRAGRRRGRRLCVTRRAHQRRRGRRCDRDRALSAADGLRHSDRARLSAARRRRVRAVSRPISPRSPRRRRAVFLIRGHRARPKWCVVRRNLVGAAGAAGGAADPQRLSGRCAAQEH